MSSSLPIRSALISVFYKNGLDHIINLLHRHNLTIYSTGGTQTFIEKLGVPCIPVESLTTYPSILGGRVKTLHPAVFGGILGRRDNEVDVQEMQEYNIPTIDLVIVDLYPFEETVATTEEEKQIIEKIDVGGPSMIRAAAKNFQHLAVIASKDDYAKLEEILEQPEPVTTIEQRRAFAARAFQIVAHYDFAISQYFSPTMTDEFFASATYPAPLRYGENPHQHAQFYGKLEDVFNQLHGKELSYNNLVDVDAAIELIREFPIPSPHPELRSPATLAPNGGGVENRADSDNQNNTTTKDQGSQVSPIGGDLEGAAGTFTFAIIKHTNVCGIAQRPTVAQAWEAGLAGDPESAFGGVLICNGAIDEATATAISEIFFEVLIAPQFDEAALTILKAKKNRILLQLNHLPKAGKNFKKLLNGVLVQDVDHGNYDRWEEAGGRDCTEAEKQDLTFANLVCKHLKSNAIALVKNGQLVGKGCGQTSRIDSLRQSIEKAGQFHFDLHGAVLASDAFFPFDDCVKMAHAAGIQAFIQPGGSIRDKDSIAYCKENNLALVMTGRRHFRH
jgi:phosphoribosylaminoimidazolecarboxamide formyltransferase / IMP cyclohydrolase